VPTPGTSLIQTQSDFEEREESLERKAREQKTKIKERRN